MSVCYPQGGTYRFGCQNKNMQLEALEERSSEQYFTKKLFFHVKCKSYKITKFHLPRSIKIHKISLRKQTIFLWTAFSWPSSRWTMSNIFSSSRSALRVKDSIICSSCRIFPISSAIKDMSSLWLAAYLGCGVISQIWGREAGEGALIQK